MSNTKHTPTPWHTDSDGGIYGPNREPLGDTYKQRDGGREAMLVNAAFIIRACNAHEQLVEALKEARELLAVNGITSSDTADYGNGRAEDIIARIDEALMMAGA